MLIAAAGTLGAWIAHAAPRAALPAGFWRRLARAASPRWAVALVVMLVALADGVRNTHRDHWLDQDRIRAHAWLGRQTNVTGAMIDAPIYTSGGPWFNHRAPQVHFDASLLSNPLFSHVVVRAGMYEELLSRHAGFEPAHREGMFVVLVRR